MEVVPSIDSNLCIVTLSEAVVEGIMFEDDELSTFSHIVHNTL